VRADARDDRRRPAHPEHARCPLPNAWQTGAWRLETTAREPFGNDPLNLQATGGPTNQAKGDGDAVTWLPPNRATWCQYESETLHVAFDDLVAHARAHGNTEDPRRRERAKGQAPFAMFIACSDSRLVPSAITGAAPGELFELRTAGNVIPAASHPTSEVATIEFAITRLGVPEIILCGHRPCGAVAAMTGGPDQARATTMGRWLAEAPRPVAGLTAVAERAGFTPEHEHLLAQFHALREIPVVRDRVELGELRLHCWFYDIGTGAVSRWRGEDHVPSFGEL
jgi:carbonic anhydrase